MIEDDDLSIRLSNLVEDRRPLTVMRMGTRPDGLDGPDVEVPDWRRDFVANHRCEVLADADPLRNGLLIDLHVVIGRNGEFDALASERHHSFFDARVAVSRVGERVDMRIAGDPA